MSYHNGTFETSCPFSIHKEKDDGWIELDGEVDGTCHWERKTWDNPGSQDIDVDYSSIGIWGDIGWIGDDGDTHSLTVRFYGKDADAFLSGWGVDVADECEDWSDPCDD
jgi:hypothetical protein